MTSIDAASRPPRVVIIGAGFEAARTVFGKCADGAGRGQDAAGVPLSRPWVHGYDRPQERGRAGWGIQGFRAAAWLLWSMAHIYFLIRFRNRLAVAMNWCWNYLTFQRGTRLITGISGSCFEDVLPAVMTAPLATADVGRAMSGRETYIRSAAKLHRERSPQHA
jgi:hypothetical protein